MAIFHRYLYACLSLILMETYYMREIKIGVILPNNQKYLWSLQRMMPSIEMAIEKITTNILFGTNVTVYVNDSMCSETSAPLAAINLHFTMNVNVLFGPVCTYALAPVAMFSSHWNIPVLTAGGLVSAFDDKTKYSLLSRVIGVYSNEADVFIEAAKLFNWTHFSLIYEDTQNGNGKSDCFFSMEVLYKKLRLAYGNSTPWYQGFDDGFTEEDFKDVLQSASSHSRIIVLCGSSESKREIMIKAYDLNYYNGDYVFISYILPTSTENIARPWYKEDDTTERNEKARRAYEAVLIFSLRQPAGSEFKQFSREIKRRAKNRYKNTTFDEDEVNHFVGAFHDAVILYGLAVNDTLEAGESISNGAEVFVRMKNRTFQGITGKVSIDSNGDRQADYSLLDMDPMSGKFEVVCNYFGTTKRAEYVQGKRIHWGMGRIDVPSDKPGCELQTSDCSSTIQSIGPDIDRTKAGTEAPEIDVEKLLAKLKLTLANISKAVAEQNESVLSITEVLEKLSRSTSEENSSCPQALFNGGWRAKDFVKNFLYLDILFACVLTYIIQGLIV